MSTSDKMVRIVTQALIGFMFLFGVLTLFPRALFHLRGGRYWRGMGYLAVTLLLLFMSVLSLQYAYSGLAVH